MSWVNLHPPRSVCPVCGTLGLVLAICMVTPRSINRLWAHEFADGHVERAVSFVVRDRKGFVEYGVGCNPHTMAALLNKWRANDKALTEAELHDSPEQSGAIHSPATPVITSAKTAGENPAATDFDTKMSTSEELSVKNKLSPTDPGKSLTRPLTAQELEIEKAFQTAVLTEIAKQFEITCNGVRVNLTPHSVELSPRHHVNALAKLEFDLPPADRIRLVAHDLVFPDNGGAGRYALKPKGSTMLLRSNVAPILVRADRIDLNGLSPEMRAQKTTVDCELSFVPVKNAEGQ